MQHLPVKTRSEEQDDPHLICLRKSFCLKPELCGMVDVKLALALNSNNLPLDSAFIIIIINDLKNAP